MLNQLDTLIGFVVVMALVSLLVTILTQMISALLGLRGKCLADALETLIYKIDPTIASAAGVALVEKLLTHPTISDSALPMKKTVLLFWKLNPKWWQWLTGRWKLASAVRPDEMLALLKDFAAGNGGLNGPEDPVAKTAKSIWDRLNVASGERQQNLVALQTALPKMLEQQGASALEDLNAAANHGMANLEGWFNSAQDRAQQWFALHTRVATIVGSFVIAFVLQLDSVQLLEQVSTDKTLRDSLVKTAVDGSLQAVGTNVMDDAIKPGATNSVLTQRLTALTNDLTKAINISSQDGLQLLPEPYPIQFSWKNNCLPSFQLIADWSWPLEHLFGIFISAALLSLGAPFWFNALKTLANLRTSLATEVDKDPKQLPAAK